MLKLVTFSAFLLIGISVLSQEPLNHTKKIYVSPEGKLYIQKELPVFLWLSSSRDQDSKKIRLVSQESANYSNPMYLDVEGFNSLRSPSAVDTSTHQTVYPLRNIIFEVYADGTAPLTKIDYGNTSLYNSEGKMHLSGSALISLSANDRLSGVENIYYSIDGAPFKPYSETILLTEEKEYILKYYSVDNVGNVEKLQEHKIVYDKTAPITSLEIEGDKFDNILSGRSKIILTTQDNGSGLNKIFYTLDNNNENLYNMPLAAIYYTQGEHTITYYASDRVGNKEAAHTYSFYIDKTAPTIIEEIVGKSFFSDGKEFSSGKTSLKLTSFDNKAGVKEVHYSINDGEFQMYDKPVFLIQSSGNMLIKSYAVDNVNNRSNSQTANEKTSIPYIDLTGPELGYAFIGPEFITRDTIFINRTTKIVLKGNDSEAGFNRIEYSVNGSNFKEYSRAFNIDDEGYSNIDFSGFDNVENSSAKSFGFKIDNTGPEISYMFGTSPLRADNGINVYPLHTVLFFTATDKVVGFQRMTYMLNNGKAQEYTGMIKDLPKGKYNIKVTAYDKLNNSKELEQLFIFE
jgi:hypothetical protein